MKEFFKGFGEIMSAKGAGMFAAIFLLLVILQLAGHGDDDVAEDLRGLTHRS